MKKYICLFVVFSLLFSNFAVVSSAYNASSLEIKELISDYDRFGEDELPALFDYAQPSYYNFSIGKPIYSAYSLLDDCQKKFYNCIVDAEPGTLSLTINFDYGEFLAENYTLDYLSEIMYAVIRDHPEIFYYNGYQVTGGGYYRDGTCIAVLNYSMILKSDSTYTVTNLPGYCADLESAVKNVPVDKSNRFNFVKSLHDYLCEKIYYPDLNSSDYVGNAHDAFGALVEGRAVCEGYSEAFKIVCDYYKIPVVCITGMGVTSNGSGAHMWNAVQMDDGYWYLLDATWDDQGSYGTYYDFFLVGLNSVDTYFGHKAFSESHISDGSPYLPVLSYATEKYSETEHNTAFKATYNSIAKDNGKYLIRSFFDASESYVYYNGMYVETENPATNGKFAVPGGADSADETWTLVLIGDCNGDGSSDALDYSGAVNKVLSDTEVTTAYDMAADVDCDGYLDVIDLAMLYIVINGFDTDIIIER